MARLRVGQQHLIVFLAGSAGSGKSKLAECAGLETDSPFELVAWNTTRFVPLEDRLLFKKIAPDTLAKLRTQVGAVIYECEPLGGHMALLTADVLAGTATKLGLTFGPSAAAKSLRDAGFGVYVIYIRAVDRKRARTSMPSIRDDDPRAIGLLVDDHRQNSFANGGLEASLAYLRERAQELTHAPE